MVEFSFVDIKVCLAFLVGDAKIRIDIYHELVTCHKVEHCVLEARDILSIVFKDVEVDELIGNDLKLVYPFDVINETLDIERVILSPLNEIFGILLSLIKHHFLFEA